MKMKYNTKGNFEYMFPETLGDNIKLNNGQTLEQWKKQVDDLYNAKEDEDYNTLWSGRETMGSGKEITMPKKLSECNHGWILVFGDHPSGSNFSYHHVPKIHPTLYDYTQGCKFLVWVKNSGITSKYLFIDDTHIKGHTANTGNGNDGSALLRVISY